MPEARAPIIRLVLFVVLVVHMQVGSVSDQVFGKGEPAFTTSWEMYSGKARNICAVRWYTTGPDGPIPIDRLAILGLEPFWSARADERLQHSEDEVRRAAQRLCRKLGRKADVRADARCGLTREGVWRRRIGLDEALCVGAPSPAPRSPP